MTEENRKAPTRNSCTAWSTILLLPFFGLCFPALYARTTPTLLGFPFFYWYQLAWVALSTILMVVVYRKVRH